MCLNAVRSAEFRGTGFDGPIGLATAAADCSAWKRYVFERKTPQQAKLKRENGVQTASAERKGTPREPYRSAAHDRRPRRKSLKTPDPLSARAGDELKALQTSGQRRRGGGMWKRTRVEPFIRVRDDNVWSEPGTERFRNEKEITGNE